MTDITPDPLLIAVAEECHVPVRCIRGPERWNSYCRARHIYAYVAHTVMRDSFWDISYILNRANHSTSHKGYKRVLKNPDQYEPYLSRVLERINGRAAA